MNRPCVVIRVPRAGDTFGDTFEVLSDSLYLDQNVWATILGNKRLNAKAVWGPRLH